MKTKVDVIEATDPAASVNLPEEASAALWVLRDAMYPTCVLHKVELRELEEMQELDYGEWIRESADFVLANTPYNGRRGRDDKKSEHKQFSTDDMKAMMRLCGFF